MGTRSMATWLAAVPALLGAQQVLPKAEEILDRYVAVTGGREAYQKRRSEVRTAKLELVGKDVSFIATTYRAAPGKGYSVMEIPGIGRVEEGTDGEVAWSLSVARGPLTKEGFERDIVVPGLPPRRRRCASAHDDHEGPRTGDCGDASKRGDQRGNRAFPVRAAGAGQGAGGEEERRAAGGTVMPVRTAFLAALFALGALGPAPVTACTGFCATGKGKVLAGTHQEGNSATQYSNIHDLTARVMYLYHFHNFEKVVRIDLAGELRKGPHKMEIRAPG